MVYIPTAEAPRAARVAPALWKLPLVPAIMAGIKDSKDLNFTTKAAVELKKTFQENSPKGMSGQHGGTI